MKPRTAQKILSGIEVVINFLLGLSFVAMGIIIVFLIWYSWQKALIVFGLPAVVLGSFYGVVGWLRHRADGE